MRLCGMIFAVVAFVCVAVVPVRAGAATATEVRAERVAAADTSAYTLPPEKLAKAVALDGIERTLNVVGTVWTLVQLVGLLALGGVAKMRDVAVRLADAFVKPVVCAEADERNVPGAKAHVDFVPLVPGLKSRPISEASTLNHSSANVSSVNVSAGNQWVQGFGFAFLVLLVTWLLNLPLGIYAHHVGLSYGLSVQGWGSWLGDRAKRFGLVWVVGGLVVMLIRWVMRRSPQRWWLWFWVPAAVSVVAGVLITPYVIDPMFNTFEPLASTNPALVARLEQVVARSGIAIPPERMFLMKASAKSTALNAYVTGFGPSKRVVVWDTTVAKSSPDEIAFIFAHELGHYALGHVALGVALSCVGLLPLFWLGYHGARLLLRRYGAAWGIASQQDWGALVVLGLVLLVVSDVSEPVGNAVSRWMEHNADVYGQEAVHGIVADPQGVGRESFQVLGEDSLDDPTPHPVYEWWFGTHPTTAFRAAFARDYDPWARGGQPKFFAK